MKANEWDKGTPIEVERLGRCTAYRRTINGEFYQWKIKHGFTTVIGDYADTNMDALESVLRKMKSKFKSIFD